MNVLIVDDHARFRAATRAMLERLGYEAVAEADDGASALVLARKHRPGLVLLDIGLPDVSGFEVAARLAELDPAPAVVLVSNRGRDEIGARARRSGASGFIPKEELSAQALMALLDRAR